MRGFFVALLSLASGLISIGAGVYLWAHSSQTIELGGQTGQSWFEVLAHGIGAYFVARGVWMLKDALREERQLELLEERISDSSVDS